MSGQTDAGAATRVWETLVFQLVTLVVVLWLVRATDDLVFAATLVVAAGVATGLIAWGEVATGSSYARWWFHLRPSLLGSDQAQVLATRSGHVRVRAASDFALAFAWTTAALVPLLLVLASLRRRGRALVIGVGLPVLVAAVLLTYSRTVVVPLVLVVVLLAVLLRDRGVRAAGVVVLAVCAFELATGSGFASELTTAADTGSIAVRVVRLPLVGSLVAPHAWTGLGLSGLASRGVRVTDSSYLLSYAEVGVLGLAALLAVQLGAVGSAVRAVRSPVREERLLSLGCGLGMLLLLGGTFTFDTFSVPAAAETFWILAALALCALDGQPTPKVLTTRARGALLLVAVVIGLGLHAAAPRHVAKTWQFEGLLPYDATVQAATFTGTQLRGTFCSLAQIEAAGLRVTCQQNGDAPGQGLLRIEGRTLADVMAARDRALEAARRTRQLSLMTLYERGPAQSGTPTGLRTAPGWLPLLAGIWLLPVPGPRRRAA
ncbi:MAG: hypothetical protein JF597_01005 [Streptomyces sp.]|uniref:hypothetical protein n=1 Tax=Streptomyces sp. TaxID=1931 RepID=UPI0025F2E914|nr:hypothetical protein [Streptomyces sp.]MBW8792217.1 hypothetical protein [Streptomyces sp.]